MLGVWSSRAGRDFPAPQKPGQRHLLWEDRLSLRESCPGLRPEELPERTEPSHPGSRWPGESHPGAGHRHSQLPPFPPTAGQGRWGDWVGTEGPPDLAELSMWLDGALRKRALACSSRGQVGGLLWQCQQGGQLTIMALP